MLQSYTGYNGTNPVHFAFVQTNARVPNLKIFDASVYEGNSSQKNMNFKVRLSLKPTYPVTVHYLTVNNIAKAPADFIAADGALKLTL